MIGQTLANRYKLVREIGRGGMGVVYQARDPLLERDVAVKLIAPSQLADDMIERFRRETLTVANMDHPSIVGVYDTGVHDGSMFFVMPLVRGRSLRQLLRNEKLTYEDLLDIGIATAEALDYSHARGVVHRDVKPENILVDREESRFRVRITDFGLATASQQSRRKSSEKLVGTISYVSPEQITGEVIDERSDVYSLGTVLYECIVGEPPFEGEIASVLYRIVNEQPLAPSKRGIEIERELERVVMHCLEKLPVRRPQRARDVATALARCKAVMADAAKMVAPIRHGREDSQTLRYDPFATSAFVNRERELAELQERLQSAVQGECQLVMIGGEPGVGKTRLLDELQRIARARNIRALRGRFADHDRAFPYQGFCEVIQNVFRASAASDTLPPDLADLATELVSLFPVLWEIDEIRTISRVTANPLEPRPRIEDRLQIFELLARALSRIGGGKPMLIVLEDLHAAEVSLDALQYIVRRIGATPTLVVGTFRTTDVDRGHPLSRMLASFEGDTRSAVLTLEPLKKSDHREFVQATLGFTRLQPQLADKLYAATEGNPYFTKELIRSLVDAGTIRQVASGEWALAGDADISIEALPATIQQTIERRIERLSDEQKKLLSTASVIGKTFDQRDLEVLASDTDEIDEMLDQLISSGFIEQEKQSRGDQFTFSSGVMRDILYSSLPRRKRKALHRTYGEHLERRRTGRGDHLIPQLLHHYAQADAPDKVIEYGTTLARRALAKFSSEEAIRACRIVLDFIDEDDGARSAVEGEVRLLIAAAHRIAGNVDGALRELGEAIRIFERESTFGHLLEAISRAVETAWEARRVDETRRWVERGCELARAHANREMLTRLLPMGATVANLRADYETANRYLQEAEQLKPRRVTLEQLPRGGVLSVAIPIDIKANHPAMIAVVEEEEVFGNVFETIATRDASGALIGCLAERWEVLDDGRAFLFTFKRDVRFHDGTELTAAVVRDSIAASLRLEPRRIAAGLLAIRGAQEFRQGDDAALGLTVVSREQLKIELTDPLPIYPALLTHEQTAIALDRGADASPRYVGTGPFVIERLTPTHVRLVRNDDYFGQTAHLDALEFKYVGTAAGIAARFRSGEFDVARDLVPSDLDEILRDRRLKATLAEIPKNDTYFVLVNTSSLAGQNRELRRALLYSVRIDDLVWRTLGRFAEPAQGVIPPGVLGHDPVKRRSPISVDRARQILRDAGIKTPVRLTAAVHPIMKDRYGELTRALFRHWSEIGIEVAIVTNDMQAYLNAREKPEGIDLRIGRFLADYDDPDNFTHGLFDSDRGIFRHHFGSKELDHIARAARAVAEPSERERLYRRFESVLASHDVFLPLFHDIDYRVSSPAVKGLRLLSTPPYVNYSSVAKTRPSGGVQKRSGGVLRIPLTGELQSIDPANALLVIQSEVIPSVFETLTRQTSGAVIAPFLASEFSPEENGRVFRFRLRGDVRFHDGRRLTSSDVAYSFERLLRNPANTRRSMLAPIRGARELMDGARDYLEGFHIRSPLEFAIELEQPLAFFPSLLTYESTAIVPEGSYEFSSDRVVGTGPFRVASFQPGLRLDLEANPYYWRKGYPRVDRLVFALGVPPRDILAGFKEGRFSVASELYPSDVEALRHDPQFAPLYHETPLLSTAYLAFNVHSGPFRELKTRQRFAQAIAREDLVRKQLHRLAIPAHSLIPPGLLGYEPAAAAVAATQADSATGVVDLKVISNSVYGSTYAGFHRALLEQISAAGFVVHDAAPTRADYFEALRSGGCDLAITRWIGDYPDADTFLHDVMRRRDGMLGRLCGTAEIDRLIERGRAETNPALRHFIYREAEEVIAREMLLLPLFHEQAYRFVRPEVEGFTLRFSSPPVAYEELSVVT